MRPSACSLPRGSPCHGSELLAAVQLRGAHATPQLQERRSRKSGVALSPARSPEPGNTFRMSDNCPADTRRRGPEAEPRRAENVQTRVILRMNRPSAPKTPLRTLERADVVRWSAGAKRHNRPIGRRTRRRRSPPARAGPHPAKNVQPEPSPGSTRAEPHARGGLAPPRRLCRRAAMARPGRGRHTGGVARAKRSPGKEHKTTRARRDAAASPSTMLPPAGRFSAALLLARGDGAIRTRARHQRTDGNKRPKRNTG